MPIISSVSGNFSPIGRSRKPFNLATGGTTADVTNYNGTGQIWRVHTLTSGQTLSVINSFDQFTILVAGGGAAGCIGVCGSGQVSCAGSGGGSGGYFNGLATIPIGSHSITIGSGGTASGGAGGTTSLGSIQSCTGGATHSGQAAGIAGSPNGINGGSNSDSNMTYKTSNITGSSVFYCAGGSGYYGTNVTYSGSGGKAAQRSGGDYPDGSGFNGTAGTVIVAYQIA